MDNGTEKPKCTHCDDKKMLRIEGTNILVPCLKCKGKKEETTP